MTTADATRRTENIGTVLIVVATAASAFAVLIYQAIASRALGTDAFAPIAVIWTVMFIIYTVLQLPAEQHLTRALVVTRDPARLRRVYRAMFGAFAAAMTIGGMFAILTLDRFFEGRWVFVALTVAIVASRSILASGRGALAGRRRFSGYAATIAFEAGGLVLGAAAMYVFDGSVVAFGTVLVVAPLFSLFARPFSHREGSGPAADIEAQPGSFLVWLIAATAASQLVIAGGPIAVSFVGGTAAAVSIFFTSFTLLRGPVTSAYNLVARVLPDFTALAQAGDSARLWRWAPRITAGGLAVAVVGAVGSALLLEPIIAAVYGDAFVPPTLAAGLGGAGVGLGLGALFATQLYTATARGALLASGWAFALVASIVTLAVSSLEPIDRVALAFVVGEGTGLLTLGLIVPFAVGRRERGIVETRT